MPIITGAVLDPPQALMLASVRILIDADVVTARRTARDLSESLALSPAQRAALVTAVGEVARNALHHGSGGEAMFEEVEREGLRGLRVTVVDRGPGPGALRKALREVRGHGMVDIHRGADAVSIDEAPGGGSSVQLIKWEDLGQRELRDRARDLI